MSIFSRAKRLLVGLSPGPQVMIDAAVLAMCVDQHITDTELFTAQHLLLQLPWFRDMTTEELQRHLDNSLERYKDGADNRREMERFARRLPDKDAQEMLLGICAFIIYSDGSFTENEAQWLQDFTVALGFSLGHLEELQNDIKSYMEENPENPVPVLG